MTEIDYEALGHEAYGNMPHYGHGSPWPQLPDDQKDNWENIARAVVAALREQGFTVVRAEDCNRVYQAVGAGIFLLGPERDSLHRLRDAAKDATT